MFYFEEPRFIKFLLSSDMPPFSLHICRFAIKSQTTMWIASVYSSCCAAADLTSSLDMNSTTKSAEVKKENTHGIENLFKDSASSLQPLTPNKTQIDVTSPLENSTKENAEVKNETTHGVEDPTCFLNPSTKRNPETVVKDDIMSLFETVNPVFILCFCSLL